MRIFLDTADVDQIRRGVRLGVVSGVTTNPSLVAKAGRTADYRSAVTEICSIVNGPVSAEVLAQETTSMIEEARKISYWSPHVVVKIPCTAAGLEAISALSREGIKTNLTLCFSPNQALLGALAGATYVSPFVGRLDDVGQDGMELVAEIVELFEHYRFSAQVIAASIRHPMHCVVAARVGAHIATVPYSVLMQMIDHPLTTIGINRFLEDWQRVSSKG
ncbi:MAG: fructose-6-phosphate aldolase [Chloroflexi bacterium RBG_13_54_8]|nr:MAG: fructose-6-phosphate aldolase [Chloroflexi bacterium RBG_13_54_8]